MIYLEQYFLKAIIWLAISTIPELRPGDSGLTWNNHVLPTLPIPSPVLFSFNPSFIRTERAGPACKTNNASVPETDSYTTNPEPAVNRSRSESINTHRDE